MPAESHAVGLRPFVFDDLRALAIWLARPHVARWFPDADEALAFAAHPGEGATHEIIEIDGDARGYLRWHMVDRSTLDAIGFDDLPAPAVDADLFLAEESDLGGGLGTRALALLLDRLAGAGEVRVVGLTSSIENARAHAAFRRLGFRVDREYEAEGFGPCHLMLLDLAEWSARGERDAT